MPSAAAAASAAPAAAAPTPPAAGHASHRHAAPLSLQDGLRSDAVALYTCTFLPGRDLACLAATASYWRGLLLGNGEEDGAGGGAAGRRLLWRDALQYEREDGLGLLRRLEHTATITTSAAAGAAAAAAAGASPQERGQGQGPAPLTAKALAAACGRAHRLSRLAGAGGAPPPMRWAELPAEVVGLGGRPIRAMEGHAAVLLDDRWMVVVGGFGMRGVENEVYVLDTWELPEEEDDKDDQGGEVDDTNNYRQQQPPQRWGRGRLPSLVAAAAAAPPSVAKWWRLADWGQRPFPPLYGHAVAALGPRRLAVFGGCTMGGYAGEVSDLYVLDLHIDVNASSSRHPGGPARWCGAVTWQRVHTLGQPLTSRAYCTLTPLPDPGSGQVRRLLVLGGIHQGRATLALEMIEIKDGGGDGSDGLVAEVIKPALAAAAPRPAVRMGHSCVLLPPQPEGEDGHGSSGTDNSGNNGGGCPGAQHWRLLVLGGSDGSDLLRNGEEHADAWRLDVVLEPRDGDGGAGGAGGDGDGPPRVVWSEPPLSRPVPRWFPMGRTHTAQHVGGGAVLCFGGGSGLTNRLGLLDTNTWAFSSPRLLPPHRPRSAHPNNPTARPASPTRPRPRLSHAAVRSGARLLVLGGWNGRELGDFFALDLVPLSGSGLAAPDAGRAAAAVAAAGGAAVPAVDAWHGGEEEEEEEGHAARRVECTPS